MTKQTPKSLDNGYYQLDNVIDVRTGKNHTVVQIKHKTDAQYFEDVVTVDKIMRKTSSGTPTTPAGGDGERVEV